jgi:hypothetical protein
MPFVASAVRAMLASERGRRALQARARNRIQKLQAAGCKSLRAIAAGPGGAPAVFPQHAVQMVGCSGTTAAGGGRPLSKPKLPS